MIGFKELVQNFKDGLPELKDIGKEGLGILGDCAKVAGEFALEGAKAAGDFAADSARFALGSGGLKLTESNENTVHEYTDWTLDDIRADREYLSMFNCAMKEVVSKRSRCYDDYIGEIARWTNCEPYSASVLAGHGKRMLWLLHFKGIRVNAGTEVLEVSRNVRLLINTPNAMQLTWDGQMLKKGYTIERSGRRESERRQNEKAASLESFLGVMFGRDYHEFATTDQAPSTYTDSILKDVQVVNVRSNEFLNFTGYQAIVASSPLAPEWNGKIVGMVCTVDCSAIEDALELNKKVRAIIRHKYRGIWSEKNVSCGLLGLGTKFLHYVMDVAGGKIYLTLNELMAVSDEYERYRGAVDAAYKETAEYKQKVAEEEAKAAKRARIENEQKAEAERREKAHKEALAQEVKKWVDEQAAKKAELSNALDAL